MQKLTRDSYHLSFSFLSARWPNIFRTLARDALKLLSWLFIFIFFNSFYLNYHFFFFFFCNCLASVITDRLIEFGAVNVLAGSAPKKFEKKISF
jgi:hypothetical protein